jgi:hypothetical protein
MRKRLLERWDIILGDIGCGKDSVRGSSGRGRGVNCFAAPLIRAGIYNS